MPSKGSVRGSAVCAALVLLCAVPFAAAQANVSKYRGMLKGTLVDEAGKPVAGVVVQVSPTEDMKNALEVTSTDRGFIFPRLGDEITKRFLRIKSADYYIRKITVQTRRMNDEIMQDDRDIPMNPSMMDKMSVMINYRGGAVFVDMVVARIADYKAPPTEAQSAAATEARKEMSIDKEVQDLMALGDYKAAAERLAKAIAEKPADPERRWQHAQLLALAGENGEAIKEGRKTLALKPDMPDVRPKLAKWVGEEGGTDEAIALLEKEREISPANADVLQKLAGFYKEAGRPDDEAKAVAKWAELAPENTEALIALAGIKTRSNDFAGAEQIFRKLAEKDPENAYRMFFNVGASIWNAKGDMNNAIAALQKSVDLKPDFAKSRKFLGDCLLNVGKLAEARAQYEKFVELAPNDPQTSELKKTIQSLPKK